MPPAAVTGSVVQVSTPPPGFAPMARVIEAGLVVTTSPEESSTETTGCVVNAVPWVGPTGCVVNTSLVAVPATVKLELVAVVRPVAVAFRVKAPCVPNVILQPPKVATPFVTVMGFVVQPPNVPVPVLRASVTDAVVLVVTRSPLESSTQTTGWVPKAVPPVEAPGEVAKPSLVAAPATVKLALVACARSPSVALRVKAPCVPSVILQPEKVAMPPTALTAGQVLRVPVPVLMATVTVEVLVVTVLPPASSTVTTGWVANTVAVVAAPGDVVKASWVAGPTETVMAVLAADARVPSVAVRV